MRVLIVCAPFGAGHYMAAAAVRQALYAYAGASCDILDLGEVGALRLASQGYLWSLRHSPRAWRTLYRWTSAPAGQSRAEQLVCLALRRWLRQALAVHKPDVVVATHPFAGAALGRLRAAGLLQAPLALVVTDFLPHPAWVHPAVDRYFVAPLGARRRLQTLGVPSGRISETGIPIAKAFNEPIHPRRQDAAPRLLIMGGSLGLGPLPTVVRQLAGLPVRPEIDAVAGNNRLLYQQLADVSRDLPNLRVHGYTNEVATMMRHASLLVGKPGGLSSSEALACGLPMLITGCLPGQEEDNAHVLAAAGAGVLSTVDELGQTVMRLLVEAPHELHQLQASALALGRPSAAAAVANGLLSLVRPASGQRGLLVTGNA